MAELTAKDIEVKEGVYFTGTSKKTVIEMQPEQVGAKAPEGEEVCQQNKTENQSS